MKQKTKPILTILHVVSWIIFIGLCIKTGAILYSFFVSLVINPVAAKDLHLGLDLSSLYSFSLTHYSIIVVLIIILSFLKAFLFYQVIKVFLKINLVHPFSKTVSALISKIGNLALGIGILTVAATGYCEWLNKKGVDFPNLEAYLGAGGEFLLMGAIVFMISVIFKRGIEIQTENELTI